MNEILNLLQRIDDCSDVDERKSLCDKLRAALIEEFDNVTWLDYDGDTINYSYINFDSNCGMTLIDVSMDAESVVEFMKQNNEEMSLNNATSIIDHEFPERSETWFDIINDESFALNGHSEDIIAKLKGLLQDTSDAELRFEEENAWLPLDKFNMVKEKIKELKKGGWKIPKLVACIYDLYQDYIISETQEEALYIIADPHEKYNEASEYWMEMDYENPFIELIEKEVSH